MLPGLVAGHYTFDEAHIDLGPLCRFAGARFYHDEAVGLELTNQLIHCRTHPPVSYDILSLNIGSTPRTSDVPGATGNVVPVKPINQFIAHWQRMLDRVLAHDGDLRIGVVGAGAGGVEILLAVQYRLRQELLRTRPHRRPHRLPPVQRQRRDPAEPQSAHAPHLRTGAARSAACRWWPATRSSRSRRDASQRHTGTHYALDEILWVTAAGAAPWLAESGLQVDAQGFVAVNDTLQSVSHPAVFAAGDIASVLQHPRPKSGVFAVRQGKPLADNLRRALRRRPLRAVPAAAELPQPDHHRRQIRRRLARQLGAARPR